ncbi:MAG: hypothetical protein J5778_04025 [Clostridiales bacterium]|nr:hypothetical protein [Clostridiales bacterium]
MELTDLFVSVILLIAGILICFNGYRFFRLSMTLLGAFIGFVAGRYARSALEPTIVGIPFAGYIIIALCIILFAVLSGVFCKKACIAITCLFFCWWIYTDYSQYFKVPFVAAIIGVVIGLIAGILLWGARRTIVALVTCLAGAKIIGSVVTPYFMGVISTPQGTMAANGIADFIFGVKSVTTPSESIVAGVVMIIFAVAGFLAQMKSSKNR